MARDLPPLSPAPMVAPPPPRLEGRALAAPAETVSPATARPAQSAQPVEPVQALDRAAAAAARSMFKDHEVEVTSYHDDTSGRFVYRVADRLSGEVLLQSPPETLLRFFADTREALDKPLVTVHA